MGLIDKNLLKFSQFNKWFLKLKCLHHSKSLKSPATKFELHFFTKWKPPPPLQTPKYNFTALSTLLLKILKSRTSQINKSLGNNILFCIIILHLKWNYYQNFQFAHKLTCGTHCKTPNNNLHQNYYYYSVILILRTIPSTPCMHVDTSSKCCSSHIPVYKTELW